MFRRSINISLGLITVALLGGCGHYQLGTSGHVEFTTLYVAPVSMKALLPQAQPIIGTQIRESLLRDGRVTLVNSSDRADVRLNITVNDYQREVATVRPGDTGLARKFTITLIAEATLTVNGTGRVLFQQRQLIVKRDVYTDSGQQQAEYQLLPQLAQDLAAKITHTVLDTW